MLYKHFTHANVDVSAVAIGTWGLGGDSFGATENISESIEAIHAAVDAGINIIDTAPCYGNGLSEKIVGKALAGLDREKLLVSTKCGLITSADGYDRDSSFKNIMREVESSLRNLGTEYLDFYFVHWPDPKTPFAETMSALRLLKEQGKIRSIGVSNFTQEQIEACQSLVPIDVQQPPYSMVNRSAESLISWGYEHGIDSLTYGSLGAGILSGAFRTLPQLHPDDVRLSFYDYFTEPKFSKIQQLLVVMDEIAATHERPVSQVALNWAAHKPYVGTCLVGIRKKTHAVDTCSALDWTMSDEEYHTLDKVLDELDIEGLHGEGLASPNGAEQHG